jgi:hypothetical protein
MSRNTIQRSVTSTTIRYATVFIKEGKPAFNSEGTEVINGTIADDKALKAIQKKHGATAVVISKTEATDLYEISVEDFMKNAKKVEPKPATPDTTK